MSRDYFGQRYEVLDEGDERKVLVHMFQINQKYKFILLRTDTWF